MKNNERYMGENDNNQWEELRDVELAPETPEDRDRKRQQDKIIAGFLKNNGGIPFQGDVSVNEHDREKFYRMRGAGEISDRDERRMLVEIATPVEISGSERVFEGRFFNDKHLRRILSTATKNDFDDGAAEVSDLKRFLKKYPTPMDFEEFSSDFLKMIGENNSANKLKEYEESMEKFQKSVFGKRFEYYQRMKELDEEVKGYAGGLSDKNLDRTKEFFTVKESEVVDYAGEKQRFGEMIIDKEGLGACMVARAVTKGGEVESSQEASEDAIFVDEDEGVFAVFDGAGGVENGKLASRVAARTLGRLVKTNRVDGTRFLRGAMEEMDEAVKRDADGGIATAVVGVLENLGEGRKRLAIASMGDSRLYIIRGERAYLMTKDEGFENQIFNALGMDEGLKQIGTVGVMKGDRIVICSDGITGDRGSDLMSEEELYGIAGPKQQKDAGKAAEMLVRQARKKDDRTVIVKDIL